MLRTFLLQPEARTPPAEEVPGGKPGFILRVLLTDAVKPGTLLSPSPGHVAFPFEVMIVFGPMLRGIYLGIKISTPLKRQMIIFLSNYTPVNL